MPALGGLDFHAKPLLKRWERLVLTIGAFAASGLFAVGAYLSAVARPESNIAALGAALAAVATGPLAVALVVAILVQVKHWIAAAERAESAAPYEPLDSMQSRYEAYWSTVEHANSGGMHGELPDALWPRALARMMRNYWPFVRLAALDYGGIPMRRLFKFARSDSDPQVRRRAWDLLQPTMTDEMSRDLLRSKHADIRALAIGRAPISRYRLRQYAADDPDERVRERAWQLLAAGLALRDRRRLRRSRYADVRKRIEQSDDVEGSR